MHAVPQSLRDGVIRLDASKVCRTIAASVFKQFIEEECNESELLATWKSKCPPGINPDISMLEVRFVYHLIL